MRKINIIKLYWYLIVILPFMDSINGFVNNGGNDGGLSIGVVYRIIILVISISLLFKNSIKIRNLTLIFFIIINVIMSYIIGNTSLSLYINRIYRLLLPIIMIISFESNFETYDDEFCNSIFKYWTFFFPITIIIPKLLGMGFTTYGEGSAGYKGFYFAQNDVGYILIILYLFILFEMNDKFSLNGLCRLFVILISNIILGLKSNYIFIVILTLWYLCSQSKKRKLQFSKLIVVLAMVFGAIFIFKIYSNEINQIISRWNYFYENRDFVSFITSARSERVIPAFNWIVSQLGIIGLLFGSGLSYTHHTISMYDNIIEMDFFDVFFQIGILGVILIYGFYLTILEKYKFKGFYFGAFWLSILIGTFAGHIMESALSGMFFALICCGGIKDFGGKRREK